MYVLASGQIQPQDILVETGNFDLVLRAHNNASAFAIVGGALIRSGYHHRASKQCECKQQDSWKSAKPESIKLALLLTDKEVLTMFVLRGTFPDLIERVDEDILTFIQSQTLGSVKAHSLCFDATALQWEHHRDIPPVRSNCPLHRSVEYYRRHRHALWYNLLTGDGAYLRVTK